MERSVQELVDAVRERRAVLFVGAGVSMNLGVPSLAELIDRMAREIGHDPDDFRALADSLTLAEFYYRKLGSLGPLRQWMTAASDGSPVDVSRSPIHRAIVNLNFPVIYTTNYDPWLERAFEAFGRPYRLIVRVADIARQTEAATEIVKLHGDLEDEDSVVFTESNYFDRLSFEAPLDIKLRADVLARPVLFIGYSLSDVNIRYLLHRLQRQWELDGRGTRRPTSYMFLTRPNPVYEAVLKARGIEPLLCGDADPARGLLRLLQHLGSAGCSGNSLAPRAGAEDNRMSAR